MRRFEVTRRIEIDAGHRVTTHGSKCRNKHGHRYAIEAVVSSEHLGHRGGGKGMVVDFGFLKDCMMRAIHDPCDHAFMVWIEDKKLMEQFYGIFSKVHH